MLYMSMKNKFLSFFHVRHACQKFGQIRQKPKYFELDSSLHSRVIVLTFTFTLTCILKTICLYSIKLQLNRYKFLNDFNILESVLILRLGLGMRRS